MAYRTLIFGTDDLYPQLKPFYDREVQRGNLDIVAYGVFENDVVRFTVDDDKQIEGIPENNFGINLAIISSHKKFFQRMKYLESKGVKRNRIIDGRVFQTNGFDFPRLLNEGIAYGSLNRIAFKDKTRCIYPRIFSDERVTLKLGAKSVIGGLMIRVRSDSIKSNRVRTEGIINVGKFCAISNGLIFQMSQTKGHRFKTCLGAFVLCRLHL